MGRRCAIVAVQAAVQVASHAWPPTLQSRRLQAAQPLPLVLHLLRGDDQQRAARHSSSPPPTVTAAVQACAVCLDDLVDGCEVGSAVGTDYRRRPMCVCVCVCLSACVDQGAAVQSRLPRGLHRPVAGEVRCAVHWLLLGGGCPMGACVQERGMPDLQAVGIRQR